MQDQTDTLAALRSAMNSYREAAIEANDRVAAFRAERDLADAKAKTLQTELDALKSEKAKDAEENTEGR